MKKNVAILSIIAILVMLLAATSLFACSGEKASIDLFIEGTAYRGAVCKVYAEVKGIENTSDIKFYIKENYDWALFEGGNLLFTKNAVVGAVVTVVVECGELVDMQTLTVGNTPITQISICDLPPLAAGSTYQVDVDINPFYADDVQVAFDVVKGNDVAHFEDDILFVHDEADKNDDIQIVASVGDLQSGLQKVNITTVQPQKVQLSAANYQLKRGESTTITCEVYPKDCTLGSAQLILPPSEYYSYSQGLLTISDNAPVGEIQIQAKLGKLTDNITIQIVKTDVEQVVVHANHDSRVKWGDVVELFVDVLPKNATNSNYQLSISEGAEFVKLGAEGTNFEVVTTEVGKQIVFVAVADNVKGFLVFETVGIDVQDIKVDFEGSVSVTVGEKRVINAEVVPQSATVKDIEFSITEGYECAYMQDNTILFVSINGSQQTVVKVLVRAQNVTKELIFNIVPIPVESVVISTNDNIEDLHSNDTVTFDSYVLPNDASFKDLTYCIESGAYFGSLTDNVFTVGDNALTGAVVIYAVSADGIESNRITIHVLGDVQVLRPANWNVLDDKPQYLDGKKSVRIDFCGLSLNADYSTLIVSDDVEYLELFGCFDGEQGVIKNLTIYFLTTDYISVKIENFAICCDGGFSDYVLDFGNYATVTLDVVGDNMIKASSAYTPHSSEFMVDTQTTDSEFAAKKGMDGFNGINGGTCINAYGLEICGRGNLKLVAGSGSSGTNGSNGFDSQGTVFAGRGGNGGYGGDSGYGVFAYLFTLNIKGQLTLVCGNGAKGGYAGRGGKGQSTIYDAADGVDGADGKSLYPIYTVSTSIFLTNNYTVVEGGVANTFERVFENDAFARQLQRYYKVNVHYGTDSNNPPSGYKMDKLTSAYEIGRMLCALEYALQTFPKNLYFEIRQNSNKAINIYLTKNISKKIGSSTVYGLTSDANNLWFATFTTRFRGIYYSTPYNIMIHELLHLLTFNLSASEKNTLKSTLPKYNLNNTYSSVPNSNGVYDPQMGRHAATSVFLCTYSKTNYSEDISDNLSLIAMLVASPDFLDEGMPFRTKVLYISSVYEGFYSNLTPYTPIAWKKFII